MGMVCKTNDSVVHITSLQNKDNIIPARHRIKLPFHHSLSVGFSALSFGNSKIEYRYRMEGTDNDWHYTSNNAIVLSAVPAGTNRLNISARQNGGEWGDATVLEIEVPTPFWCAQWFIAIVVLAGLSGLFYTTRKITKRREAAKYGRMQIFYRIAYLKQQALSALINPHFVFNCMNSIQYYLNRNDNATASEYLADFARLIRLTLEQSQQAFIPLSIELERLKLYLSLEQLRFEKGFSWDIYIDPALDRAAVHIPNMIIQPFVENAIWHGIIPQKKKGNIAVRFAKGDNEITITIEDDGKGFNVRSMRDKGLQLGMRLTGERLALLKELSGQNYDMVVKSGIQVGTAITLTVPMMPDETLLENLKDIANE